ncbi:MAG: sulfatase-like hydrolase/transferase, partial [Planctomycetota bacterium]
MKRALALLLVALASSCSKSEPASVLLVTLDTTRADALGCYGAKPAVTPHLDALAAEGITVEWARTVTPTTLPTHTSMLTGLYPHRHTVRDNSLSAVPASATTVAELARAAEARWRAALKAASRPRLHHGIP